MFGGELLRQQLHELDVGAAGRPGGNPHLGRRQGYVDRRPDNDAEDDRAQDRYQPRIAQKNPDAVAHDFLQPEVLAGTWPTEKMAVVAVPKTSVYQHERAVLRGAQWIRPDGRVADIAGDDYAYEPELEVDLFSLLVAFRGVLERSKVAEDVKSLDQAARAILRKHGGRQGLLWAVLSK